MIQITQYRQRCIGCNYCVEAAPYRWYMSHDDGKSVLVDATEKKPGLFQLTTTDDEYDDNLKAAIACPVHIIKIRKLK